MPATGDRVRIHYTGRLPDGTTFDSSEGREPLEFVVGVQQVISGLDQAILEMDPGESRTVTIPPEEAYGPRQPGLEQRVDRSQLPEGVSEGVALQANVGGQDMVLWVTELDDDSAVVDPNHPLAGQTLVFDVELVGVDAGG